jgi:hypothetical protein
MAHKGKNYCIKLRKYPFYTTPEVSKYYRDDRNLPGLQSLIPHQQKKLEQNVYRYALFINNSSKLLNFCTHVDFL